MKFLLLLIPVLLTGCGGTYHIEGIPSTIEVKHEIDLAYVENVMKAACQRDFPQATSTELDSCIKIRTYDLIEAVVGAGGGGL